MKNGTSPFGKKMIGVKIAQKAEPEPEAECSLKCKKESPRAKSPQPSVHGRMYRLVSGNSSVSKRGFIEINLDKGPEEPNERSRSIEKLFEDAKYRQLNRIKMQQAVHTR